MVKVKIERFENDPEAQGRVFAEDGSWEVVVDTEGVPHLWISTFGDVGGERTKGLACVDDFLVEGITMRGLVGSEFGGELSPEEQAEAEREHAERVARGEAPPCPGARCTSVAA